MNQLVQNRSPGSRLILVSSQNTNKEARQRQYDAMKLVFEELHGSVRSRIHLLDLEWDIQSYLHQRLKHISASEILWLDQSFSMRFDENLESQIYLEAGTLTHHYLVVAGSSQKPMTGTSVFSLSALLSAMRRIQASA